MNWPLMVFGVAAAGYAAWTAWSGWRARRWPVAPGHVVAFAFPEVRRKGQTVRTFEVRYRYDVGGRTFDGRRIGFGLHHVVPPAGVGPGDPVRVYYDPSDPAQAVLRPGVPAVEVALGVIGAALAFGGALGQL